MALVVLSSFWSAAHLMLRNKNVIYCVLSLPVP